MLRRLRPQPAQPVTVLVAVVLALSAGALALPARAWAGGGGSPLHVDPASPVAKAYALPLDTVRAVSANPGPGGPGSEQTANLFGAGITPASRAQATGQRARAIPAAYRVPEAGSSSGLAWMAAAAVTVLALGGAGALMLRRRR